MNSASLNLRLRKWSLRPEARTNELEKTIADYLVKIGTRMLSLDIITKVEQRQMLNDNSSNNSSSNFNSL
jgi:hypothetical protein